MSSEMLQLLLSADDSDSDDYYAPVGFNWKKEMARVRSLKPQLENILGQPLELDEQVQDASFFTQLAVFVSKENPSRIETAIAIMFSASGNLFTVWSSVPEMIPATTVQSVIAKVQEHGFHYIDDGTLKEPYSGSNPIFQGENWCYRFFSYL